jgi:hypothetical protein
LPAGNEPLPNQKPEPIVRSLLDLAAATITDGNNLLGNRFLCRGGGLLFIGSSGIGKSTAVIQMGISWAVGRQCFGIPAHEPLKILYVQAENDEGDLCEMRDGVLAGLQLTSKELERLESNFTCVFESTRTGAELVSEVLEPLVIAHTPDLLILDPALSYIGGAVNEQETVGGFLRNQLNPLVQKHRCGVLIVHHTNKPNGDKDGRQKLANDFAYAGSGSAEWANWARAVLVLSAKNDVGLRQLQIGKRFRLGWLDWEGKPTAVKSLQQSESGVPLFYKELSAEDSLQVSEKVSPLTKVLRAANILPLRAGEEISKEILLARIMEAKIGRDTARGQVIPKLVDEGYLVAREVPRHGVRPEIRYVRTAKQFNVVSFVARPPVVTNSVIPAQKASQN